MKCPKCDSELKTVNDDEHYHMCHFCIEGWTTEELNGIERFVEIRPEVVYLEQAASFMVIIGGRKHLYNIFDLPRR